MKLLIAAPETLGEIVCSTALLRCIKKELDEAEIYYWVAPEWAAAVARQPAIHTLYVQSDDPYGLPQLAYHAMIDLRADRQLRQWARRAGIRYLGINASFLVSFLSEHFGLMNAAANASIASRFFDAVKPLHVHDDGLGSSYVLGPEEHVKPTDLPHAHSAGYLVLVVADHDYDVPVPNHFLAQFCSEIAFPIVLVSSRGANNAADRLSAIDPVKIYNACGKFTLNETADIIQKSKLVICPETGLMQVAAAFGKKVLVLRSANRPSAYYPPCYGRAANNNQNKLYAQWIWPPDSELRTNRKLEAQNKPEPWLAAVLKLVQEMLAGRQIDQLGLK
jgi:ADP-heptose:LPS heptosyltransferase